MAESLKGKVAVISGVGSGFGKATAELFAAVDQVNLVLIDYNEEALKATADACEASGSKVVALAADVTKLETCERALAGNAGQLRQDRLSSSTMPAARSRSRPSRRWTTPSTSASST